MRIVKVGVLAPTNKGIPLGVQGENSATQVEFDTRPWFREYPYGTVSAVARRDGDPAPYPLTLDVEYGTAVWQVSDTDTAKAGEGAVELTMTSAGARVRSLTFKTLVTASLTDAPVDDDAWYGWLDKAVVKVDETVQAAQRKMAEVDEEWTGLKADVTAKVEECGEVAAKAAEDAHHAKVDAQATAKALESADGSVAKAEAAAKRAADAMLDADDSAVEASNSALSAGRSAEAAAGSSTNAATSASYAATSASNAADAASAASRSASAAEQSATDASNAKAAAQTAKAEAEAAKSEAATSASNAAESATAAAKSASDAAASVGSINVIAPQMVPKPATSYAATEVAIGMGASATGGYGIAIGQESRVTIGSVAIGSGAVADGGPGYTSLAIGDATAAHGQKSVAAGSGSIANNNDEFSIGIPKIGSGQEYTREITHVSTPTAPTSASNKKYTDDNDAKTLSEAKKYTDENTSNALVGTVSGKLLHVEDAWPGNPLSVTIDGAYKQDGTPSPDNPVPITVIENTVLKVTGKNQFDGELTKDGNTANLIYLSKGKYTLSLLSNVDWWSNASNNKTVYIHSADNVYLTSATFINSAVGKRSDASFTLNDDAQIKVYSYGAWNNDSVSDVQIEKGTVATDYEPYTSATVPITLPTEHPYLAKLPDGTCDTIEIDRYGNATLVAMAGKTETADTDGINATVGTDALSSTGALDDGATVYYKLATPVTYHLGKLDIPALPESISNVWTEAELTTNMSMTYKRDINIAFENLAQAVVAAAAGE